MARAGGTGSRPGPWHRTLYTLTCYGPQTAESRSTWQRRGKGTLKCEGGFSRRLFLWISEKHKCLFLQKKRNEISFNLLPLVCNFILRKFSICLSLGLLGRKAVMSFSQLQGVSDLAFMRGISLDRARKEQPMLEWDPCVSQTRVSESKTKRAYITAWMETILRFEWKCSVWNEETFLQKG